MPQIIQMLDLALYIFIYSVAVYRFTLLLYEDDGPWDSFARLRAKAGIHHMVSYLQDAEGQITGTSSEVIAEGFFAKLLSCPYCLSLWLAILATIGLYTHWFDWIAIIGCIAGLAHFTFRMLEY